MDTIIIVVASGGNIYKVISDMETARNRMRRLGLHPHENENNQQNWYDIHDHFKYSLWEWRVEVY